jgi:secreted trypsin-like serine protease
MTTYRTGKSVSPDKIFGGTAVTQKDTYPWMGGIFWTKFDDPEEGIFCGGTLIDPEWVLTAGHCLEDETIKTIYVRLGLIDLRDKTAEKLSVKKIFVHPDYDRHTTDFDVALLHLAQPSKQRTIGIIPSGDPLHFTAPGKMATIIGWGKTEKEHQSRYLLEANVPIVPDDKAKQAFDNSDYNVDFTENMFSAGFMGKGKVDTCQGDSGGPILVVDANLKLVQAGVTSCGIKCGDRRFPGIYSRLAVLGDWVRKTMKS